MHSKYMLIMIATYRGIAGTYLIAGYLQRVFIFGYFEEAFFCENKLLCPTDTRKYILMIK